MVEPPVPVAPTVADSYEPTLADRWALIGLELGRAGCLPIPGDAFPDATAADLVDGAFAFRESVHAGYREYARSVGHAMGLDGRECERPATVPARFASDFEIGHERGERDAAERARIMREHFAGLDREQARWDADLRRHRETCDAKGWPYGFPGGPGHAA